MHKGPKLNGGALTAFIPIGEDGRPVWQYAGNFRQEIIRSRALGNEFADFLAIPEFTDQGRHVDWFCPFEVKESDEIVMWQAASPEEQAKAYSRLLDFEHRLTVFGQDLEQRALTGDAQLFAHFITGTAATEKLPAIHFPDLDCIYIVGGRPVITFWGFIKPGHRLSNSPFVSLKPQATAPKSIAPKQAAAATATVATLPWWKRWWWLWLLPLLLLLLWLLWWLLWPRLMPDRPVTLPLTEAQKTEETAPLQDPDDPLVQYTTVNGNHSHMDTSTIPITNGGTVEDTDGIMEGEISQDDATLHDEVNATDAVAENANEHVNDEAGVTDPASSDAEPSSEQGALPETEQGSQEPLIADPVPKNAASQMPDASSAAANNTDENGNLVLDPAAVAQGNVRALNGSWNTSAGLIDSKTGKRVSVKYDFKDGQGQAQVSRSDGVKCTTSTAGSAVSGALEIAGGNAACTDGGVVQLPKVRCVPSKNGKAQCSGSYESSDGTSESVDMELYK